MKLNAKAFGNAFAGLSVVFYVLCYILQVIAPELFVYIFNAQFLGADIASLIPGTTFGAFVGILVAVAIVSWICGYLLAHFYNKFNK